MRRVLLLLSLAIALRCAAPAPPPPAPTPEPPPAAPVAAEERVIGTVRVTASALNVRVEASAEGEVVAQVKKGTALDVLAAGESWTKVRLAGGEVGWVASRFVSGGETARKKRSGSCPPDSDYAFVDTPLMAFSDSGAHGLVVVDAKVSTKGSVTGTKVVLNTTGDDALAFLAAREIRGARFSAPIRNCVARGFVFTYRRTF